jgi:hypothetical protein
MPIPNQSAATYTYQAEPDSVDFDIITAASAGYGVASGCVCTAASSGSTLGVAVSSGSVHVGSKTPVAVTGVTVTPGAASGSAPRLDLIVVSNAGVVSVVAGTADATPEFPAVPASRTVLAAVSIPTSATSITNANIIDKRQIVDYNPAWGTTSTTTARGDHNHAGNYASTAHASTHAGDGSDPLLDMSPLRQTLTTGVGFIRRVAQATVPTSEMDTETQLTDWVEAFAWRPVRVQRSYWSTLEVPDTSLWGVDNQFALFPGTSTTPEKFGAPFTSTGTLSHPSPTVAHGFHTAMATAASANATASVASTDTRWVVGDAINPWTGFFMITRLCFPDASYANSGASTGSRIFCGLTDQSVATILGSDNPAGHRFGFQYVNVNAGKTQTTFQVSRRDGTTETLTNTTIAITQNKWYDFVLHIQPNYSSFTNVYAQIRDTVAGTVLYESGPLATNLPGATTFMRAVLGIQTINAVARNVKMRRMVVEASVS